MNDFFHTLSATNLRVILRLTSQPVKEILCLDASLFFGAGGSRVTAVSGPPNLPDSQL